MMFNLICLSIIIYVLWDMNKKCRRFRVYELSKMVEGKIYSTFYPQHRVGPFWFDYNESIAGLYLSKKFSSKKEAIDYLALRMEEWKHGKQKRKYYIE